MKVGDLVIHQEDPGVMGIILRINDKVEVPSLVEIMWSDTFTVSRTYADDLQVVSNPS